MTLYETPDGQKCVLSCNTKEVTALLRSGGMLWALRGTADVKIKFLKAGGGLVAIPRSTIVRLVTIQPGHAVDLEAKRLLLAAQVSVGQTETEPADNTNDKAA